MPAGDQERLGFVAIHEPGEKMRDLLHLQEPVEPVVLAVDDGKPSHHRRLRRRLLEQK